MQLVLGGVPPLACGGHRIGKPRQGSLTFDSEFTAETSVSGAETR
jgi:hypothetical protein